MSSKIDDLHFWDFESSSMPENQLIISVIQMLNYRQQDFMIIMDYYFYIFQLYCMEKNLMDNR